MINSIPQDKHWSAPGAHERGSLLLMCLLALGALWSIFCLISHLILNLQTSMAEQSRLDVCAVKLMQTRTELLEQLVSLNRTIEATRWSIYAARGIRIMGGGIGILAGVSEKVLIKLNQAAATKQELHKKTAQLKEWKLIHCARDRFSESPALCFGLPQVNSAFKREVTAFSDVKGPIVQFSIPIFTVRCTTQKRIAQLNLTGDRLLRSSNFQETYAK